MISNACRSTALLLTALLIGAIGFSVSVLAQPCEPDWEGRAPVPGPNWHILTMTVFDDGNGPALYAGGMFTGAGGVKLNHIAKWDGQQWSPLGAGVDDQVLDMIVFDDGSGPALYAAGDFTEAGGAPASRIAKWDGNRWSPLGLGIDRLGVTLAVFDDGTGPALYVGGDFYRAGGQRIRYIAKWDGQDWSTLGRGVHGSSVSELCVFDDGKGPDLYVGGDFEQAGRRPASHIARWNGRRWSALGGGIHGRGYALVPAMRVFDDGNGRALYVGGLFSQAGEVPVRNIARWTGKRFESLGAEPNGGVWALAVHDDGAGESLYAGGPFSRVGEVMAEHLARWDGKEWSSVGAQRSSGPFLAVASFADERGPALYVGGTVNNLIGCRRTERNIARWACPDRLECDGVHRLKAKCGGRPNTTIRAKIAGSPYADLEGDFTLTLDGDEHRTMQFRCDYKHKVKWRKVSPGSHEVCVVGCPKHCVIVE